MQRNATQLWREADQVRIARRLPAEEDRRVTLSRRLSRAGAHPSLKHTCTAWEIRYCDNVNWQFKTSHVRDPRSASAGAEQGFNP